MKTLQIRQKTWAVGLWWQTLNDSRTAVREAKKLAQSLALSDEVYNVFALRLKGILQAGYGTETFRRGKMRKQLSLAAALADAKPTSWLGRFQLGDGVYVVAIADGIILPDGDFFGTATESAAKFDEFQQYGEWSEVIDLSTEPESLSYLEDVLKAAKKLIPVQAIEKQAVVAGWLMLGFFLVAALVGWLSWMYYTQPQAEAPVRPVLSLDELTGSVSATAETPAQRLQYASITDTLTHCRAAFSVLELHYDTWQLQDWTCFGAGDQQLKLSATAFSDYSSLPDGAVFSLAAPNELVLIKHAATPVDLVELTSHATLQPLTQWYQEFKRLQQAQFVFEITEISEIPAADAAATPHSQQSVSSLTLHDGTAFGFSWQLVGQRLPFQHLQRLAAFDGGYIRQLTWSAATQLWTIQGDLYVSNKN